MNKGFQEKLNQYAPPVPEGAWDAIEARLNEGSNFASRLQSFEAAPPPGVWEKIISNLPRTGRVKPLWKKVLPYGLAAALLGFVVFTGNLLNHSSTSGSTVSTQPGQPSTSVPQEENKEALTRVTTPQDEPELQEGYSSARRRMNAGNKSASIRQENGRAMAFASYGNISVPDFIPDRAETKPSITSDYADKYMVHTDERGNAMRVPKKIFQLVDCVKVDPLCKDRIENLQQKIALSSVTTEFAGLLDLIKNLKENQ